MRHADVPTAEFRIFDHPEHARRYIETRDYPLRGQGRRTRRRQGRHRLFDHRGSAGGHRPHHGARRVRPRRRPASGRRETPGRRGTEHSRPGVGTDHRAACSRRRTTRPPSTTTTARTPAAWARIVPPRWARRSCWIRIDREVLVPTVHAMKRRRQPFRGVLYAGIMTTNQGPRVLEFNCRFGDPETQPLLMRLRTDLLDLIEAVVDERLDAFEGKLEWDPRPAVCVVMASGGYPGNLREGSGHQGTGRGGAAAGCEGVPCRHAAGRRPCADRRRPRPRRDGPGRYARRRQAPRLRGRGLHPIPRRASIAATSPTRH